MITPNHCKCKNNEKHWKPPCPTVSGWNPFKPRNLKSTPIYQHIQSGLKYVRSFLAWQRSSRNLHIAKYSSSSAFMSSKFQAFKTWSRSVDLVKIHRSDFHETLHEIRDDIKPCKGTQEIDPFQWWCHSTWLGTWTSQEDLKFFHPWKMSQDIARKTTSHPVRLQSVSIVIVLTTALARPQVDTLGIEFHQKDVILARVGVPIQGATRAACHPGIANVVHLRKDRQLSFAVLRRCAWKLKEIQETDRIIRRKTDKKKWNQDCKMAPNWQLHAPRYQDETNYTVSTLRRAVCSSAMFVSVRTWILNRSQSHQT